MISYNVYAFMLLPYSLILFVVHPPLFYQKHPVAISLASVHFVSLRMQVQLQLCLVLFPVFV